jgi:ribulose-5-phosphate 4-epimerase/fuculose-1-phosphate aldolase
MSSLSEQLDELVIANHILAHEGVVDSFGHVSLRHPERPDRFFLSRSRAPELVAADDLMEFDLECHPIDQRDRAMYSERPIHGAIYQARPDVFAVVHNHAHEVIPFGATAVPLRPIFHMAGSIGPRVPVWDIAETFGETDLLVRTLEQGRSLASTLGSNSTALMRGHGCVVAGGSLRQAVAIAVYLMVNARLVQQALAMGTPRYLSDAEVDKSAATQLAPDAVNRAWDNWARRCGS